MGIIEPYKKIDCIDINDLTRQQRILELELQMLQNEMKQVELMKSLQTSQQTIARCEKEAQEATYEEFSRNTTDTSIQSFRGRIKTYLSPSVGDIEVELQMINRRCFRNHGEGLGLLTRRRT